MSFLNKCKKLQQEIISMTRFTKRSISVCYDFLALFFAVLIAASLRKGGGDLNFTIDDYLLVVISIVLSLLVFSYLGLYRAVLRYMGSQVVISLLIGVSVSAAILITVVFFTQSTIARSVPVIYWFMALVMVGGPRWLMSFLFTQSQKEQKPSVVIFGAGKAGRQLLTSLLAGGEYSVVGFIDEDPMKYRTVIQGVPVYSLVDLGSLLKKYPLKLVLLALGTAKHAKRKEVLDKLTSFPVEVLTIPSMSDVISGRAKIEELKEIDIDDLLGRESVEPNQELLTKCVSSKVVMVTGAGGSIGSELCRQICKLRPKALVLFELSEFALYSIERELLVFQKDNNLDFPISPFLGSVQHKKRLAEIMAQSKVQTVYHAAAYKHVPLVELNVIEGIRNNVFGTWFTAEAAIEAGVETFVLVSTDKAVRPTNFMGASKRLAELVLQSKSGHDKNHSTVFCMVRFGNVLGSSGSVVPLFRSQIKSGGPITLTHPEITRFFMTIPEASQLVIQAGAMGKGGDVFVLDMGESVKIIDLATRMVNLMGLTVKTKDKSGDIEIIHSGLRPGEKLYEELLVGDNVEGSSHPKIMTAKEEFLVWDDMEYLLKQLDHACHSMSCDRVKKLILSAPVGYNPQHDIKDMLWVENAKFQSMEIIRFNKKP